MRLSDEQKQELVARYYSGESVSDIWPAKRRSEEHLLYVAKTISGRDYALGAYRQCK